MAWTTVDVVRPRGNLPVLPAPEERDCSNCTFFVHQEYQLPDMGHCHRHPQKLLVEDVHWCGEWKFRVRR